MAWSSFPDILTLYLLTVKSGAAFFILPNASYPHTFWLFSFYFIIYIIYFIFIEFIDTTGTNSMVIARRKGGGGKWLFFHVYGEVYTEEYIYLWRLKLIIIKKNEPLSVYHVAWEIE